MKTTRTLAISAILGFAFALCASAKVVYDDEFTNAWFNVVAASANLDDTTWTKPQYGDAEVKDSRIKLDTDLDDPLIYDPEPNNTEVAIVTARFQATANTGVPDLGDNGPQAALTVIANGADTNWYGLARVNSANEWVKFPNVIPVVGQEYDIQIEFDLRQGSKRIRYSVGGTVLGEGWYDNPQQSATSISTVSFSGTGDIGDFAGDNVAARTPVADVTGTAQVDGCDYTNGTLQVNLNAAAAGSATLRVIDFKTGAVVTEYGAQAFAAGTGKSVSWDVAKAVSGQTLVPGGTYGYEVTITASSTGQAASQPVVKTGTFTAASTTDANWFHAWVANGQESVAGGSWTNAVETSQDAYQIDDGAYFEIDDSTKGENNLTRVDAEVIFESMVDADTLVVEDDALGGFVAAKENDVNVWKALSKNGDEPAWVTLSGAIAPEANMPYVIRAEVSFIAGYKQVRYLVSADNGTNFSVLTGPAGKQWIPLAAEKTTLAAVELKGSGTLASLTGGITDRALAEVGGVKYYSMAEALAGAKGSGIITLFTNVTLAPTVAGRWTFSDKSKIKGIDLSGVSRSRARWDGNTLIVETSLGATYLIW